MRRLKLNAGAFTLIEVLLAVAIFSVVLAAMSLVFSAALRMQRTSEEQIDEAYPVERALMVLRSDLQGAVPPGGSLARHFRSGASTSMRGRSGEGLLEFFSSNGSVSENTPWGDIQRISYELRPSTNQILFPGKDLIRSVTRNLLPTLLDDPEERLLLGGIRTLELSFSSGGSWASAWDTTGSDTNLPRAVRVNIQMETGETFRSDFDQGVEILVMLGSQVLTNRATSAVQSEL